MKTEKSIQPGMLSKLIDYFASSKTFEVHGLPMRVVSVAQKSYGYRFELVGNDNTRAIIETFTNSNVVSLSTFHERS